MAHTHPGNEGDYLKHVLLEELLLQVSRVPDVEHVRHIDPYAGEGLFDRPAALHAPAGPSGKPQVWNNQQDNSAYYLGSPLVALQALQRARSDFSLRLSDSDFKAVAVLDYALRGGIPQYEPGHVPRDTVVQVTTFTGAGLGLWLAPHPTAVNVVLLDPTHSASYITTINNSVAACQASGCNAVAMCWGLQSWNWPASFSEIRARAQAVYSQGRYPSVVHLLWFGPFSERLETAATAALQGW